MASVSRSASRREDFRNKMRKSLSQRKSKDLRRHMLRSRYGSSVESKKTSSSSSSTTSSASQRSIRRAMRKLRRGHGARRSLAMSKSAKLKKDENDTLTVKAASVVASLINTCNVALDSTSSSSSPCETSSEKISMTPLIESMRSCRISSDSPAECDARQDVSNNEMTKKRLFTIPEKVVPVMNECETIIMSTPPPPPAPPAPPAPAGRWRCRRRSRRPAHPG